MLYLEDLEDGMEFQLGSVQITKEAIIQFARDFDPQEFHLDESIAIKLYGRLFASGWHTASLCNRLIVDGFLGKAAGMASPGIDDLKFIQPAFVGDVLTGKLIVQSTRVSETKPDRGLAKMMAEMRRADGTLVLSMVGKAIIACRPVEH